MICVKTLLKLAATALGAGAAIFTTKAANIGKQSLNDEFCDVVIILGGKVQGTEPNSDLKIRINKAAEYLKMHPCCIAIATGAKWRKNQDISEAECIKNNLVSQGVEESRIIIEDEATTTYENFEKSLKIIEGLNIQNPIIGILSNDYHLYRAGMIAGECGIYNPVLIGAKSEHPVMGYARENVVVYELWGKRLKKAVQNLKNK